MVCINIGFPWSNKNCFGRVAPIRFPTPPAVIITDNIETNKTKKALQNNA
jgi:hypothetical protein